MIQASLKSLKSPFAETCQVPFFVCAKLQGQGLGQMCETQRRLQTEILTCNAAHIEENHFPTWQCHKSKTSIYRIWS